MTDRETSPAFAALPKSARKVFAAIGRAIGDGDCDVAAANGTAGLGSYDVCEFTSPAVLNVKTGRGEFFFLPGVGRKASVMTEGGIARCVMAAPNLDY